MKNLQEFEKALKISFNDESLLQQALVHRSYINENRGSDFKHNERLEFLGDAVLELVVTDYLYNKYTSRPEGELTSFRAALVNTQTLSEVARSLGINEFLYLSKGESKDTGRARDYILADAVEALIGAIYLDRGYEDAKNFILKNITPRIDGVIENNLWIDAKSCFQEKAQELEGFTPEYRVLDEEGPDHDKQFTSGVFINNELISKGKGKSKQDAEQEAAREALKEKGWN